MNFGSAIEHLKAGNTVARGGWNGKGMFLWLNKGSHDFPVDEERTQTIFNVNTLLFENGDEGTSTRMPNINMKAADGTTVTGWLASQTDMLAEDWEVVKVAEYSTEATLLQEDDDDLEDADFEDDEDEEIDEEDHAERTREEDEADNEDADEDEDEEDEPDVSK